MDYFAVHMKNIKTGKIEIQKVKAANVDHATSCRFGYKSDWKWTGSEPWHNVADQVEHIGRGFYRKLELKAS